METKLDLEYVAARVGDVQAFMEVCPNPTTDDIGKMLAIQAGLLQAEGLALLQECRDLESHKKFKRLGIAVDVLGRAETSFMSAAKIIGRREASDAKVGLALEARRMQVELLIGRAKAEGLFVDRGGKLVKGTSKELALARGRLRLVSGIDVAEAIEG